MTARLSTQTKIVRALAFGWLRTAHPDELTVLRFLASQAPSRRSSDGVVWGYAWKVGGQCMTHERWAVLLGMHRNQLHRSLNRLMKYRLVGRIVTGSDKVDSGGDFDVRHKGEAKYFLTGPFCKAATAWYDQVWVGLRLPSKVKAGADPDEVYVGVPDIPKIDLPPRPQQPRPIASLHPLRA